MFGKESFRIEVLLQKIDRIDLRILDQLQQDCSLSMAELADTAEQIKREVPQYFPAQYL